MNNIVPSSEYIDTICRLYGSQPLSCPGPHISKTIICMQIR